MESEIKCDVCQAILIVGMWPFCPHGFTGSHRIFKEYEVDLGSGGKHRITSIQDAQRLERDTERAYRNGDRDSAGRLIGPVVLRAFHQDKGNLDKPVFDPPPFDDSYRRDPKDRGGWR